MRPPSTCTKQPKLVFTAVQRPAVIGAVAAGLAAVLRALGAAVDAAQVVVHAELRPLAARGAARVLLGLLPFRVHRRAVLCQEKRKD